MYKITEDELERIKKNFEYLKNILEYWDDYDFDDIQLRITEVDEIIKSLEENYNIK